MRILERSGSLRTGGGSEKVVIICFRVSPFPQKVLKTEGKVFCTNLLHLEIELQKLEKQDRNESRKRQPYDENMAEKNDKKTG